MRDAEIGQNEPTHVRVDEDVFRFDVAMHYSVAMYVRESIAELERVFEKQVSIDFVADHVSQCRWVEVHDVVEEGPVL